MAKRLYPWVWSRSLAVPAASGCLLTSYRRRRAEGRGGILVPNTVRRARQRVSEGVEEARRGEALDCN